MAQHTRQTRPTAIDPSGRSRTQDSGWDVVVVGARVAGAATALQLARRGQRVLMVDRRRPGKDTLSTHALMRGGVLQLKRWGVLNRVIAADTAPIRRTVIHYGDSFETIPVKPKAGVDALYAPRRTVLDEILVDEAAEAGVDVRFGVAIDDLLRDASGRVAGIAGRDELGQRFEARARITVGADGGRSTVARKASASTQWQGEHSSSIIYGYWSGEPLDGYDWFYRPGVTAGLIPTNGGEVCVWVGAPQARFLGELRGDLEGSFHRLFREAAPEATGWLETARRRGQLRGFPGVASFWRQPWGPGWALVGDASHFKDPLSAHGMTDALRDAEFLAQAIANAAGGFVTEDEALSAYGRIRDRLSTRFIRIADSVASYDWSLDEVKAQHMELSRAMNEEVDDLLSLEVMQEATAAMRPGADSSVSTAWDETRSAIGAA